MNIYKMDFRLRHLIWFICCVSLYCEVHAETAYPQSHSQIYESQSGGEISEQKPLPQFPSLDNLKSVQIQSGYSGILIPQKTIDKAETYLEAFGVDKGILEYVKALIPRTAKAILKFAFKVGAVAVAAVLILLITSSIATAFCSYSELCSFKFASLGWQNERLEESMRSLLTPEKMSILGSFVHNAISKYDNLYKKKSRSLKH